MCVCWVFRHSFSNKRHTQHANHRIEYVRESVAMSKRKSCFNWNFSFRNEFIFLIEFSKFISCILIGIAIWVGQSGGGVERWGHSIHEFILRWMLLWHFFICVDWNEKENNTSTIFHYNFSVAWKNKNGFGITFSVCLLFDCCLQFIQLVLIWLIWWNHNSDSYRKQWRSTPKIWILLSRVPSPTRQRR